jgi:hypothetical protein
MPEHSITGFAPAYSNSDRLLLVSSFTEGDLEFIHANRTFLKMFIRKCRSSAMVTATFEVENKDITKLQLGEIIVKKD